MITDTFKNVMNKKNDKVKERFTSDQKCSQDEIKNNDKKNFQNGERNTTEKNETQFKARGHINHSHSQQRREETNLGRMERNPPRNKKTLENGKSPRPGLYKVSS